MGIRTARTRCARSAIALCATAALALAASACGDDDSGATEAPEATPASGPPAPDRTGAPDPATAPGTEPETAPTSDGASTAAVEPTEPVPGITETAINISVTMPVTGPYSEALKKPYENGIATWAAEVNANGGIHGRQINLVKVDNQFPATEGGVAACKEIESNDSFMAISPAAGPEEIGCLDAAGIPTFWLAPSSMDPEWNGVVGGLFGPTLAPIQVSFWRSSYLLPDVQKVGIVCQCYHPVGQAAGAALADEAAAQGIETITVNLEPNQVSYVGLVTQLEDAGVELVMLTGYAEGAGIIQAAESIDFHPLWTASASSGTMLDNIAKVAGGAFDGMDSTITLATSDTAQFQEFVERVREHHGDEAALGADTFDLLNYGYGLVVGEMLEQAGPNPTRESFIEAMKSIDHFETGVMVPFTTLGKEIPVGIDSVFPATCCNTDGTWRVVGPAQSDFSDA